MVTEKRKLTKKQTRQLIYQKFGGRCAYCGEELNGKFHVDEVEPCCRSWEYVKDENGKRIYDSDRRDWKMKLVYLYPERLHVDNQFPACASCNINKHSDSVEGFRKLIQGFMKHLNQVSTQYKIAKRYGLVKEDIKPVVFYFETYNLKPDAENGN